MFEWLHGTKWPELTGEDIRKRARILVIDDEEFPYIKLFRKDGFSIDKWPDIKDLPKLESGYYDIILLDIQGVGREQSPEQGLGVLKHLHNVNPAQIVIAYSSADWSLKYQDFFEMADARLPKSDDYYKFKEKVDQLLKDRFSLNFYVNRICTIAGDRFKDDPKLQKFIRQAILRRSTDRLEQYLNKTVENKEMITLAIKAAKVAITLLGSLV
jgi:hypothetical protein